MNREPTRVLIDSASAGCVGLALVETLGLISAGLSSACVRHDGAVRGAGLDRKLVAALLHLGELRAREGGSVPTEYLRLRITSGLISG